MNKYKYDVFNRDLEKLNYTEIANWIVECRSQLNLDSYIDKKARCIAVKDFTDEWTRHYEANKGFYSKPKFSNALLSLALEKTDFYALVSGKNTPLDIMSFFTPNTHYPFYSDCAGIVEKSNKQNFNVYVSKITECFSQRNRECYRFLLDDIIKNFLDKKTAIQIKRLHGVNINKYKSYDELIKDIENIKNYKNEIITDDTTREISATWKKTSYVYTRKIKIGYQKKFIDYGISRSVFDSFVASATTEKNYDKKMFINLGFLMSLPYSLLNTFLSYNGYTLNGSTKKFDEIVERAFKIGFGRDLTVDLIDFYNFEMEDKYKGYAKIQNLC